MTIFVGNLERSVREEELNNLFSRYGQVRQIKIMKDQYTGESKGFAFIDMFRDADAALAIRGLDKKELAGKVIDVSKARQRTEGDKATNRGYGNRDSSKKRYS